jgi:hypothetical protein
LGIALPLKAITVSSLPKKKAYKRHEAFESSGMVVTGIYIDDSTQAVSGYTLNPVEGDKQITAGGGEKTITVTYHDQTTTFTITVDAGDAWKNKWVYFGIRGGGSMRRYTLSEDLAGTADIGITYEAGALVGFQVSRFLAIQAEAVFTGDKVVYGSDDDTLQTYVEDEYTASFNSMSLMIPVLAKVTFRPGIFLLAVYGGAYYTLPLGDMQFESDDDGKSSYKFSVPIGVVGGLDLGIKLGPGALFLDARYAADLGNTSISDGKGNLAVYSRQMLSFSLGYEIGIINRKKR